MPTISEGVPDMKVHTRRAVSEKEVTAKLDALALEYQLDGHCYEETASESMAEFDALKWNTLCAQRIALRQRKSEAECSGSKIAAPFLGIYKTTHRSASKPLENTAGRLSKLAA
jgi:hypothetical protein